MFKDSADVIQFIDTLEEFMRAVVNNMHSTSVEDAVYLNKKRNDLHEVIEHLSGIAAPKVDESATFACPECGGDMQIRTNRQNGEKFWGCKKYPNCRGTRDSAGLSREERAKEKDKSGIKQDSGFSFNRQK